jgi:hypothetical protein
MRKLTYIFCIALFFLVSLLSVCNVHAMDQREGINILIEAKKMSKNQQHDEAIKKLEFLIQEIQDDPRLSKQFYTKASKMIVQINRMKEKDLKRKQREEKRNVEYDERAAAKAAAITAIDQSKINDGKYLKKVCKEADPGWSSNDCAGGEDCDAKERRWISELDSNLVAMGLSLELCKKGFNSLKNKRNFALGNIRSRAMYRLRGQCSRVMHSAAKDQSEYGLSKLDQNIKEMGLDINQCPSVKMHREKTIEIIAFNKKMAAKRADDNRKINAEARAKAKAKLEARVEAHYKSGLFKKFTTDDLKDEEEDRQSGMKSKGLSYDEWVEMNKQFATDHAAKLKLLKFWDMMYFNYMSVRFCDKNQGRFDLIQDMSEIKDKMKVIDMMLPLQIDPDVLWSRVEGGIFTMISKTDGVLSDDDFMAKMGPTCRKSQMVLIMTYDELTKSIAVKKRKRSKKDF